MGEEDTIILTPDEKEKILTEVEDEENEDGENENG